MSAHNLAALMRQLPTFRDFPDDVLAAVMARAERVLTAGTQTLIETDVEGYCAYLLIDGDVRVLSETAAPDDEASPEAQLQPGTLIGEMAMLVETCHSATVQAHGPAKLLRFRRADMHKLMEANPRVAQAFLSVIAGRLGEVAEEMRRIDTQIAESEERLAALSKNFESADASAHSMEPA